MIDSIDARTLPLPVTVPCPLRMRFASPDRVYTVVLAPDLFGQWTVTQSWGGKGSRRGGGKVVFVESFDAGIGVLRAIAKRREQHGYQQENPFSRWAHSFASSIRLHH